MKTNIKFIKIPGINGLGNTIGVESAPDYICNKLNLNAENTILAVDNLEEQEKQIYQKAKQALENTIFIGGDHSISFYISKAFFEKYKNGKLVVFDAHPDLMPSMREPTHEEWLRAIVEKTNCKAMLIGVRRASENIDKREIEFAENNGIKIVYADELQEKNKEIMDFIKDSNIYLSLDIDVFDETIVKATGYPEKNGPDKQDILNLLRTIKENSKITTIDIIEINPKKSKINETMNITKEIINILT